MKSKFIRSVSVILAFVLCLGLAGCYSENNTWAAKLGDETMPIGGYIYNMYLTYSEAATHVSSEEKVLSATIEGEDAKTWITDRSLARVKAYFYILNKFNELGLELTEEDISSIESSTASWWPMYQTTFEEMGIAKESFEIANFYYSFMMDKVFAALYGEGGELEVSKEEREAYFLENYTSYDFFYVPLSTTDDEGNAAEMTSEEKTELMDTLKKYVEDINSGKTTVEEAASDYAEDTDTDSTYDAPAPAVTANITSTFSDALAEIEIGEATFVEAESAYYVIGKLSCEDKFDDYVEDETQALTLLTTMKGEEFEDSVFENCENVEGLVINNGAINLVSVNSVVIEGTENGTMTSSTES